MPVTVTVAVIDFRLKEIERDWKKRKRKEKKRELNWIDLKLKFESRAASKKKAETLKEESEKK